MNSVSIVARKACSLNKYMVGRSECMQGFMSTKEREAEAKKQAKADKLEIKRPCGQNSDIERFLIFEDNLARSSS